MGGGWACSVSDGRCLLFLPWWMLSLGPCPHFSPLYRRRGCIRGPNPLRVESKGRGDQLARTQHRTENGTAFGACRHPSSGRRHGRHCEEEEGGSGVQSSATQHSTVTASASVPAAVGSRNMQGLSHWGDVDTSGAPQEVGATGGGAGVLSASRVGWSLSFRSESRRRSSLSGSNGAGQAGS